MATPRWFLDEFLHFIVKLYLSQHHLKNDSIFCRLISVPERLMFLCPKISCHFIWNFIIYLEVNSTLPKRLCNINHFVGVTSVKSLVRNNGYSSLRNVRLISTFHLFLIDISPVWQIKFLSFSLFNLRIAHDDRTISDTSTILCSVQSCSSIGCILTLFKHAVAPSGGGILNY